MASEEVRVKYNKTIENDFFFLVNNMNIRHNNCDPKDTKRYLVENAEYTLSNRELQRSSEKGAELLTKCRTCR